MNKKIKINVTVLIIISVCYVVCFVLLFWNNSASKAKQRFDELKDSVEIELSQSEYECIDSSVTYNNSGDPKYLSVFKNDKESRLWVSKKYETGDIQTFTKAYVTYNWKDDHKLVGKEYLNEDLMSEEEFITFVRADMDKVLLDPVENVTVFFNICVIIVMLFLTVVTYTYVMGVRHLNS